MANTDICPFCKKLVKTRDKAIVVTYVANGFTSNVLILMI